MGDDQDRAAELALTERVGRELARLGLQDHLARARSYYRAIRAGRSSDAWSHDLNVEWLRMLRLPPHENDYPALPRMSRCGCDFPQVFTACVFPGGSLHTCHACRKRWLELDALGVADPTTR